MQHPVSTKSVQLVNIRAQIIIASPPRNIVIATMIAVTRPTSRDSVQVSQCLQLCDGSANKRKVLTQRSGENPVSYSLCQIVTLSLASYSRYPTDFF